MPAAPFQRLMSALWRAPSDPSIHADMSVDAEPALEFLARLRRQGHRVTPTALVVKACAYAGTKVPEANMMMRWGRPVPRPDYAAWVYASDDEGHVTGRKIDRIDELDIVEVQRKIDIVGAARDDRRQREVHRFYGFLRRMPIPLLRAVVRLGGFAQHNLRRRVPGTHLKRDGWGAVGVTNLGTFGLDRFVAVPIPPVSRHSVLLTVGRVRKVPVVRDDRVVAGQVLPITATLDHRFFVGVVAARLYKAFRDGLSDPSVLGTYAPGLSSTGSQEPVAATDPAGVLVA